MHPKQNYQYIIKAFKIWFLLYRIPDKRYTDGDSSCHRKFKSLLDKGFYTQNIITKGPIGLQNNMYKKQRNF